jgi:putative addiction module component (TIGR02574 family)
MPRPVSLPPPGFDELSVDEKIDYLQSLWDRITATPESIPVPDWHREILDERLKDLEADPGAGDSWDAVQERLRKKFDSRH